MTFAKNQEIVKPVSEAKLHISRSEKSRKCTEKGQDEPWLQMGLGEIRSHEQCSKHRARQPQRGCQ